MKTKLVRSRFIKWCLRHFTKIYNDYKPVKQIFEEPTLYCKIGRWRRDPCLPVWRYGRTMKIFGRKFTTPLWLTFYVFNWKTMWKTKWDTYRYEFPPQWTLVFFGLSISFWLHADESYWESILYYTDPCKMSGTRGYTDYTETNFKGDIVETGKVMGQWTTWNPATDDRKKYWALNPLWLRRPYYDIWREYCLKNDD